MDGESPEVAALGVGVERREEARGPVDVVAVGAYGDEAQRRLAGSSGVHAVKRRNSAAYSSGVRLPPQPQLSLPTPQRSTLKGAGSPLAARCAAKALGAAGAAEFEGTLPAGALQYSISW